MRDRRRTPAGGVQAEKQRRYVQLIAQGVSNSEACRLVGINRKTGNRWRYGRRVRNSAGALVIYPPVKITESRPRSPRYLSSGSGSRSPICWRRRMTVRENRGAVGACAIDDQPRDPAQQRPGRPLPAPSRRACRSAAGVQAAPAPDRCATRCWRSSSSGCLAKRWSPEQVAHELRVLFAGQPSRWLCKETIYQAIYDTAVSLTRPARRRRRRRRLQGSAAPGTADGDANDR